MPPCAWKYCFSVVISSGHVRYDPGQALVVRPVQVVGGGHRTDHRDPRVPQGLRACDGRGDADAHPDHRAEVGRRRFHLFQQAGDLAVREFLASVFICQYEIDRRTRLRQVAAVRGELSCVGARQLVLDTGERHGAGRARRHRSQQRHGHVVLQPDDLRVLRRDRMLDGARPGLNPKDPSVTPTHAPLFLNTSKLRRRARAWHERTVVRGRAYSELVDREPGGHDDQNR